MDDINTSYRTTIIGNIIRERMRQVQELQYTPEHDDKWTNNELVDAAGCYMLNINVVPPALIETTCWPFHHSQYKPKDRISDLTRAAALLVAEMERIMRAQDRTTTEEDKPYA